MYLLGNWLSYSYEVIVEVWKILRTLRKWQRLEEPYENMLRPFKNRNLGTTFSLFFSGWPLSICNLRWVLPRRYRLERGRSQVLSDQGATRSLTNPIMILLFHSINYTFADIANNIYFNICHRNLLLLIYNYGSLCKL